MEELIKVKQLPIIEQQLKNVSKDIDIRINELNELEVNEDTVKEVKKVRTEFKKNFEELEEKRKKVKKAILTPYEQFEEIYKNYISNKYKEADSELKTKIDDVENRIKLKNEQEVKEYFEEYKMANKIDFVEYEQANIKVNLSDSLKSLKEQAKGVIDRIANDLELIETQEHKAEILVEYKQNLNVSKAITIVTNRFKAIEDERKKEEKLEEKRSFDNNLQQKCEKEVMQAPEIIEEKIYTTKFTVKATRIKLQELKKFLNDGGYVYE